MILKLIILMIGLCKAQDLALGSALAEILTNLETLGNTELVILTDFTDESQSEVLTNLPETPVSIYDINDLRYHQTHIPLEYCPIFGTGHAGGDHGDDHGDGHGDGHGHDEHGDGHGHDGHSDGHGHDGHGSDTRVRPPDVLYQRDDVVLHKRDPLIPSQQYRQTFFIWVNEQNLPTVMDIFNDTVMWCAQKIETGIFQDENRFFFFSSDRSMTETLFNVEKIRLHPQVSALEQISTPDGQTVVGFYSYNFYHKAARDSDIKLTFLWKPGMEIKNAESLFTEMKDFQGHHFIIATNPWSHHVLGDTIPEEEGGNATMKYRNYWGYEIDLLVAMSETLNFTYTIVNPEDGKWGHIEADGTWSGLVAEAAFARVDFVICDIFLVYSRWQVFDGTLSFDKDYQAFASPRPLPLPKYLALINPFDTFVWICFALSIFVVAGVFWAIARSEGKVKGAFFKEWAILKDGLWYAFGTLVGEAITRDTNSSKASALRFVIAVWILYCFIATASYAGNLKAFLTTPTYTKPMNTLSDVLKSNLPWGMVLYGEEEEEMMAQSTDPVIKKVWDDKVIEEYHPTPRIERVYEGKYVFIDWKSGLEPAIFVRYSTQTGDPLIHVSSNPVFMPNYPGWAFHKFNPWRPTFDIHIQRTIEAGLVEYWKGRTWIRMKQESIARGEGPIAFEERPDISALTMDDMQGIFYLCVLMIVASFLAFVGEQLYNQCVGERTIHSMDVTESYSGVTVTKRSLFF